MNYTEQNWEDDMRINKFCGEHANWFSSGCTLPCPQCRSVGFYGPKVTADDSGKITRKYRACKFCGFWQEAWGNVFNERGGESYRCIIVRCNNCAEKGGFSYDWQTPWAYEPQSWSVCHTTMEQAQWASDDPNHSFHQLKEQMDELHQ